MISLLISLLYNDVANIKPCGDSASNPSGQSYKLVHTPYRIQP